MKNVVFLDVDGVLNCVTTKQMTPSGFIGIMPSRVKLLKQIVEENDADIVLVSSWKSVWSKNPDIMELMRSTDGHYLNEQLAAFDLKILNKTNDNDYDRGHGIVEYLKKHPYKNIVILDDEIFSDYYPLGLLNYLIKTGYGPNGGLKPKHVRIARRILEGKPYIVHDINADK